MCNSWLSSTLCNRLRPCLAQLIYIMLTWGAYVIHWNGYSGRFGHIFLWIHFGGFSMQVALCSKGWNSNEFPKVSVFQPKHVPSRLRVVDAFNYILLALYRLLLTHIRKFLLTLHMLLICDRILCEHWKRVLILSQHSPENFWIIITIWGVVNNISFFYWTLIPAAHVDVTCMRHPREVGCAG